MCAFQNVESEVQVEPVAAFRAVAAADPERPAIVSHRATGNRLVRISYGELAFLSDRIAGGLREAGVFPGVAVAAQMPNRWEFAALALACARIGAVFVPVPPVLRGRDVDRLLDLTASRICVVPDSHRGYPHADMLAVLRPGLPNLVRAFVLDAGRECPAGLSSFSEELLYPRWEIWHGPEAFDRHSGGPLAAAYVSFRLGPRAEPEPVLHSVGEVSAQLCGVADLGPEDVVFAAAPVTEQFGLLAGVLAPLTRGATVLYSDVWHAGNCLGLCETEGVTAVVASPAQVDDLLDAQAAGEHELPRLSRIVTGSAGGRRAEVVRALLGATLTIPPPTRLCDRTRLMPNQTTA